MAHHPDRDEKDAFEDDEAGIKMINGQKEQYAEFQRRYIISNGAIRFTEKLMKKEKPWNAIVT